VRVRHPTILVEDDGGKTESYVYTLHVQRIDINGP
jgi:hypothetical protein